MKKNSKGYYTYKFKFDGKYIYVRCKTQQGLLEKVNKKRKELEDGKNNRINPTINSYYKSFTDIRRREINESTIRTQKHQYELIANVIMTDNRKFGEMPIKAIKRRDIEYARQTLLNMGKTPQNLNNCFAHLNHVFNSAMLDETIEKNPCKALKQLKRVAAPINETKHRALTIEETEKFFEVTEKRNSYYKNLFLLMIMTGMRIGEASALFLTDIDSKEKFIYVRRTITRDEVGGYIVGDNTKTINGNRDIPLTDDVYSVIKSQKELNRMCFGFDWSGLLFKSVEGNILREYQVNREIKRICKDAEIPEFTCHAFRNTFATRFIEQRPQDFKILSEILGHKDVSITLNLYTHVMTDNKIQAMNSVSVIA